MLIILRTLRLGDLLNELSLWRNMMRALQALSVPFFNLGVSMYFIYMLFAIIAVRWLGGRISTANINELVALDDNINSLWIWLNMNDYGAAINTLFGIMTLNDWENIALMYGLTTNS